MRFTKREGVIFIRKFSIIALPILAICGIIAAMKISKANALSDEWAEKSVVASEVTKTQYVTILDESLRVIASSNPNTPVDSAYTPDAEGQTEAKVYKDQNLLVYVEIALDNEKLSQLNPETNYFVPISNNLVPNSSIVIDQPGGLSEPQKLLSNSIVAALGGVFKDENEYKLRVNFQNYEDQTDIAASYQFNANFSDDIVSDGYGFKALDFGDAGTVQVLLSETPVEPAPAKHKLSAFSGWTDYTRQKHSVWTITLDDLQETPSILGNISFAMPEGIITILPYDYESKLDIALFADDVKLEASCSNNGNSANCSYTKDGQTVAQINFENPMVCSWPRTARCESNFVSNGTIEFGNDNTAITGVRQWIIAIKGTNSEALRETSHTFNSNFQSSEENLSATTSLVKTLQDSTASVSIDSYVSNGQTIPYPENGGIKDILPESLNKTYKFSGSSDIDTVKIEPRANKLGDNIYAYAIEMSNDQSIYPGHRMVKGLFTDGLKFIIDGTEQHFKVDDEGLVDYGTLGIIANKYGINYKNKNESIFRVLDGGLLLISDGLNPEGDHYYIYLPKEQIEKLSSTVPTTRGWFEDKTKTILIQCAAPGYSNMSYDFHDYGTIYKWYEYCLQDNQIFEKNYTVGDIEFDILNAAGAVTEIKTKESLFFVKLKQDFRSANESTPTEQFSSQITVKNSVGTQKKKEAWQKFSFTGWSSPVNFTSSALPQQSMQWATEIYAPWINPLKNKVNNAQYQLPKFDLDLGRNINRTHPLGNNGKPLQYDPCIVNMLDLDAEYTALYPCYKSPYGSTHTITRPLDNTDSSTVWYNDSSNRVENSGRFWKENSWSPLFFDEASRNGYFRGEIGMPPLAFSTTDVNLAGNNIRYLASNLNDSNNPSGLIRLSLATDAEIPEAHIAYGFMSYGQTYTWLVIDLKADARKEQINTKKLLSTKAYTDSNGDYIIEKEWQVSVKNGTTEAQAHTRYFGGVISIIDKFEDQTVNSNGEPIGDYTDYELKKISTNGTDNVRCEIGYSCRQYNNAYLRTYQSLEEITDSDFAARWYAFDRDSSRNMRTIIETAPFTAAGNQQEYADYKNAHDGIPDRNMTNGFYVNLYNLAQNDETIEIGYVTKTNLTKFLEGEDLKTTESRTIDYANKAIEAAQLETSSTQEFKDTINYAAQLSISQASGEHYEPYRHDYTTELTVGMTPADEIRSTEFIAGYVDGGREHILEKTADKESVEALTKISTPTIKKIYDKQTKRVIYDGNEAKDDWIVTITPKDENGANGELFSISLKKNNGTIDANTSIVIEYSLKTDMEKPEFENKGFRYISDYYNGGSLDIYTNTRAERSFDGQPMSDDKTDPSQNIESLEDEYEPYIYENRLVTFAGASVVAEYIKASDPSVVKGLKKESDSVYNFEVNVKMPSNGNTEPLVMDLRDNLSFGLNSEEAEQRDLNRLSNIISKHSKYTDISVSRKEQYEYSQTRTLPSEETLVENANIGTNENINVTSDSGVNTYIRYPNGSIENFNITVSNIQHDDIITAKYTLIIDWQGVYDELKRIVAEETGSRLDQIFLSASLKIMNESYEVSAPTKSSKSSSTVSIGSIIPKITKRYYYRSYSNSESEWDLKVESKAKTADKLVVKDTFTALTDGQTNEAITQALEVTDIYIIEGNTLIYKSTLENPYPTGLDASKLSVETSNNTLKIEFIGDELLDGNKTYYITYHTDINPSKLAEADIESSGTYRIYNESSIKDDKNETSSHAYSTYIDYGYPVTLEKYSSFDESDPAKANYSVSYSTGVLPRYDVVIADSASADQLVLGNLSIENPIIKINGTEYTPAELPEGYKFTPLDELTDDLKLYKLEAAKIPANTNIEINYSLRLNKEQYLEQGGEGNNPNKVNNTVSYTDRRDEKSASAESTVIASEVFTKSYNFTQSESSNGKTYLDWSFNLNLLENMEATPDTVVVKDELQESLNYVDGSIKVYRRVATEDGYTRDAELLEGQDYQFALNGRTIEITILNPSENPIIEIAITTECLSSISNLQNKSSLTINGESRATISKPIATVFTKYTAGTVTSRNRAFYTIVGQKYLDGKLSEKQFDFKVKELNCDTGETLSEQTVKNDTEGNIEFGSFQALEPASRCYEISEIANQDGYKFDSKVYHVNANISDKNGELVVETIIDGADEIIFENETDPEDSDGPNTTDMIRYSFATIAVVTTGFVVFTTAKTKLRRR